ncbi:BREX-2 system adenine-specific DNA-methyltransferase PglX [Cellulomonas fimi]|uniref:site-specific DNA-methyltransferase (adenine-specific) n=1 Tax=Cellulomonas fimi TaxID=1708 RepID=A0A7Y0QHU8_CELFI|nr:BREX-2 system adenine-specific DNA-methyltransferase PglX [Cellulomonas fimi]NMR20264.1 BREX-2 system adenine-specific DNA-methyltransferase PglX [Cellulomonas fimi]
MIVSSALLADLKRQLAALEGDLRAQSEDPEVEWSRALRSEHARATARGRTALTWSVWRDGEVAQAAVAWILASTFVRFCEDNHLLDGHPTAGGSPVWIAGPGERTAQAVENQQAHYEKHPTDNSRDWLHLAFRALADLPAGRGLVDPGHNPVWRALISDSAADALVAFWRRRHDDGALVHDFTDPDLGTRFLGDLYQDLSEHAKKTYALLQTPVFVEEFILDRTLTPAIEEFGLGGLKLIDPTCGSGHFLLGAFARLDEAWRAHAPNLSSRERVQRALDSIHGVDLNPFAVAIARFRLTVAALKASGDATLTAAPAFDYYLAVGDSLLGEQGVQQELGLLADDDDEPFAYAAEDLSEYAGILTPGRYHVVVGNPPYITVKDPALSEAYRKAYATCHRQYALSVPFMELFFRLAKREGADGGAGHVGQITSNSFMKREFGTKVIERLLSGDDLGNPVDLTAVIDTSGAYIPGHGTPTVILVGRRRRASGNSIKAVLGVRGEPGQPTDPGLGLVWSEITGHIDDEAHDGKFVTVTRLDRDLLRNHPWSLSGGSAAEVLAEISRTSRILGDLDVEIGRTTHTGLDEAFYRDRRFGQRRGVHELVPVVLGDEVRDFALSSETATLFPYADGGEPREPSSEFLRELWPMRTALKQRVDFGHTPEQRGLRWFDHSMFFPARYRRPMSIAFPFVATHNHFVLDRGGKVFKQTAPAIKLQVGATEDDHLGLLSILNTSTACFWLKQVSQNRGDSTDTSGARVTGDPAFDTYEFTGTKLQQFPLPSALPIARGRRLEELAVRAAGRAPGSFVERHGIGDRLDTLGDARTAWRHTRERMIYEQEELDWNAYRLYGLVDDDLTYPGALDTLRFGERAFEIALARAMEAGTDETVWFERHGSTPITDFPAQWPADYRDVVKRRLAAIESNPHIRLLERPEYKRRWATASWESQLTDALRTLALDRLESADLWRDPQGASTLSVAQLADKTRDDDVLRAVLTRLTGSAQYDAVQTLTALVKDEAVPYLAAYRLKDSGMTKFREWQQVWDLQRREDAGERVTIPVPPKYAQADFRSTAAWRARGKLDVPKERFISYPGVGRSGDTSPVLGWAGWNHADQALALARAVGQAKEQGAETDALTPLLAGLAELEPWLHQWHADPDPARGGSPAAAITGMLDHELQALGLTRTDLDAWRPASATRGRTPRKA